MKILTNHSTLRGPIKRGRVEPNLASCHLKMQRQQTYEQ
jgi:hypothetical protein